MKRRLAILAVLLGLLGVVGMNPAQGSPDPERETGNACPKDERTPPNCGHRPCADTDGDGVCNEDDECPNEAGPADNDGCPVDPCDDADEDGVCDEDDECPNEAGPASNDGCPETFAGPCHRGEGLAGQGDPTQNPLAEQVYHGAVEPLQENDIPVPAEEPGAKNADSADDNSSLSEFSRGFYGGELGPIGNEVACIADMLDPAIGPVVGGGD